MNEREKEGMNTCSSCLLSAATNKNTFNYEAFYEEKLDAKKSDNSYRVFKKVSRCASRFPSAMEHSSFEPQDITVWCSNDYMGMTWHPKVQQAVMYVCTYHLASCQR